ncbi:MAG: DUF3488 domain-containing protein [Planctomycetes bacterium]|nr:DUF3488 domain-containing protein [Planctomycetota bacterium]
MNAGARESLYSALARLSGLVLVVLCVLFQRRGLMDWSELVFLGLCIGMQETFLRLHVLRRLRTPMLVFYSMMPLMLVLYHGTQIRSLQGDFVQIVLYTPLPLVLVSVQIMVLYVRENSRLVSVVLVLALFSTVIGVRRPMDDSIWPWLAAIGAAASLFLMLQHPGMLFHGVYMNRRRGVLPPSGRPGGIIRGSFFSVLPLFTMSVLVASLFLYFSVPRLDAQSDGEGGYIIGTDPGNTGGQIPPDRPNPGGGNQPDNPDKPPDPTGPATVSGLSNGVDLGDFGEIKRSNTPALDVRLVAPPRERVQQVYLRAFTYAQFDGQRWEPFKGTSATSREVAAGQRRDLPGAQYSRMAGWKDRRYQVTLKEAGVGSFGQLPVPVEAQALTNYADPLYYNAADGGVLAPQAKPGDSYDVFAHQLTASTEQMRAALRGRGPASSPRPAYLQVPEDLRSAIKQRFTFYDIFEAKVRSPDQGAYATASDIVAMFATFKLTDRKTAAWTYSLDFRPEPGPDAIARFLDTKAEKPERFGHCEYFASAMCALLRCYGVPSRVVAGFLANKPNDDGVFEVTAASAHAWVEVYFDNYGWLAFDPTPSDTSNAGGDTDPVVQDPKNTDPKGDPNNPDEAAADGGEAQPKDWLKRYDSRAQQEVFRNIGGTVKEVVRSVDGFLARLMAWLPDWLFPSSGILRAACVLLPPAIVVLVMLFLRRKRKKIEAKVLKQMGEGGRKRERSLYFQLLLLLARHGFQKRASETPREFARRVLRKGGEMHKPILELTEIYYALRFGLEGEMESDFKRELAKYSSALRGLDRDRRSGSSAVGEAPRPA